jgi:hypothetical protein
MGNLKKIKDNFKVKLLPSIIVTVCAVVLICGVHYIYAALVGTVTSNQTLTAALWNNMANHVNTLRLDCTVVSVPLARVGSTSY